jgi:uncharacterized membrane protein
MSELDPKITELESRLESLVRTQINFQKEITAIRNELTRLRAAGSPTRPPTQTVQPAREPVYSRPHSSEAPPIASTRPSREDRLPPASWTESYGGKHRETQDRVTDYFSKQTESARANLEKFIGENLISKVGILILILGVGIGAKYAIDNNLISPLTRILLGYIVGFGLLALAAKLKAKYLNFSAVLLSGAMAIMYFITYFAYATYQLIGQTTAFPLMVIFTTFTVTAAVLYNRQVIAHFGLVGAYAVPFLLSEDSGRYSFLFGYMSVINAGILAISVKKYWKPIFYTASIFTWLIFGSWFSARYDHESHFYLALTFLGIFATIFYATKIVHGVVHSENENADSLITVFATGVIFYSFLLAIGGSRTGIPSYTSFFVYLAVASVLILITSWRFYGRMLIYLSYPFTWLIFGRWFVEFYDSEQHFVLAAIFAGVFFTIYYIAALIYKLAFEDLEDPLTAGLLLSNSFMFYGFTYAITRSREASSGFEGLLTVGHAAFHGVVSQIVSRLKTDNVIVVQILTGLVLTFSTLAIPVQFDGNIVTMVWAVEAAVLFGIGRMRGIPLFEYFSYPLMALAAASMLGDWVMVYYDRVPSPSELNRVPLTNGDFLTAIIVVASFATIFMINRDDDREPPLGLSPSRLLGYAVAAAAIFTLYNAGRLEISNYHHQWLVSSRESLVYFQRDIGHVNFLWQMIYTMLFVSAMTAVNLIKARSQSVAFAATAFGLLVLTYFITVAQFLMYELRVAYVIGHAGTSLNVGIRYISYFAATLLLGSLYANSRDKLIHENAGLRNSQMAFEVVLTITLFISLSCELVNLMAQFSLADGTKLGLSILWGVFALAMVVVGIASDRKYQRIAAITLLAVTLVKLFFYDITDLGTIPKTILFISLGTLLLMVSFLYNKYKNLIFAVAAEEKATENEL